MPTHCIKGKDLIVFCCNTFLSQILQILQLVHGHEAGILAARYYYPDWLRFLNRFASVTVGIEENRQDLWQIILLKKPGSFQFNPVRADCSERLSGPGCESHVTGHCEDL